MDDKEPESIQARGPAEGTYYCSTKGRQQENDFKHLAQIAFLKLSTKNMGTKKDLDICTKWETFKHSVPYWICQQIPPLKGQGIPQKSQRRWLFIREDSNKTGHSKLTKLINKQTHRDWDKRHKSATDGTLELKFKEDTCLLCKLRSYLQFLTTSKWKFSFLRGSLTEEPNYSSA